MIYKLYVIQDVKASYQPQILSFENDAIAMRWFRQLYQDSVDRDPNGSFASYPEDFRLMYLGMFDCDDGHITYDKPTFICSMHDFRKEV